MSNYGTEFKINVHIDPLDGYHMSDYNFECEFFCKQSNPIVLKKEDLKKVDDDNYIAILDSVKLGIGSIRCKITADIPDADFPDGTRKEVKIVSTGIVIS